MCRLSCHRFFHKAANLHPQIAADKSLDERPQSAEAYLLYRKYALRVYSVQWSFVHSVLSPTKLR